MRREIKHDHTEEGTSGQVTTQNLFHHVLMFIMFSAGAGPRFGLGLLMTNTKRCVEKIP